MIHKIKYALTQTRIAPLILSIVITIAIGFIYMGMLNNNHQANQIVEHLHTENIRYIHSDRRKIFKYRSQLQSLQDDHTSYLLQDVFKRLQTRSHLKPSQFHYERNAKYIKMTASQARLNNRDNTRIHNLTQDVDRREAAKSHEYPHQPFTNATHQKNAHVFTTLAQEGGSIGILLILDLAFISYTVKFKEIQVKHWRQDKEAAQHAAYEKRRQHYIAEYGDDKGFQQSEEDRIAAIHQAHAKKVRSRHTNK